MVGGVIVVGNALTSHKKKRCSSYLWINNGPSYQDQVVFYPASVVVEHERADARRKNIKFSIIIDKFAQRKCGGGGRKSRRAGAVCASMYAAMLSVWTEQIKKPSVLFWSLILFHTNELFLWSERVNIANISGIGRERKSNIKSEILCSDEKAFIVRERNSD